MPSTIISRLKSLISRTPFLNHTVKWLYFNMLKLAKPFRSSESYWEERYRKGATSGEGSYNRLALFKAEIINSFVKEHSVATVVEFGCGDGNQLLLAEYQQYLGVDVSASAIDLCRKRFHQDNSKSFVVLADYDGTMYDLSLSLDVIYHLVEKSVFEQHMRQVFSAAKRFVIIYSSNTDTQFAIQGEHIRHRRFTDWVATNLKGWKLVHEIPNRFPYTGDDSLSSFADFFIYQNESDL